MEVEGALQGGKSFKVLQHEVSKIHYRYPTEDDKKKWLLLEWRKLYLTLKEWAEETNRLPVVSQATYYVMKGHIRKTEDREIFFNYLNNLKDVLNQEGILLTLINDYNVFVATKYRFVDMTASFLFTQKISGIDIVIKCDDEEK